MTFGCNIMKKNFSVIRSNRKTISVEIRPDLQMIVRAPMKMSDKDISRFISDKSQWIEKHFEIMKKRIENQPKINEPPLDREAVNALAEKAMEIIPPRVEHFSKIVEVTYGKITIRNQRSRWGSCSQNGNLNFNCLLMLCPTEVIDYVVVHELCHRKHLNHSAAFWAEVRRVMPDYEDKNKWLKENGACIIGRMN